MTECITQLKEALGEAVSVDPQIIRSYDHDLGEMPGALMKMINHVPDMVVAAKTVADVQNALKIANAFGVPVTPRGQATSGYGGVIPSDGGMVLDVSGMNHVLTVDKKNRCVDVEPGVVWENLSAALAPYGLDNCISPTSGPSSSVGGWYAMGGVGIGSLRFGDIGEIVEEIDVVGVNGELNTYRGGDMDCFHQTCGILGLVTRLRLRCRPASAIIPLAAWVADAKTIATLLPKLESEQGVYSVTIQSEEYAAIRAKAEGHSSPISGGFLLSIAVFSPEAQQAVEALVTGSNGRMLDAAIAQTEWKGRYYPMRIKRIGPSVAVGEFYLPVAEFQAWWEDASRMLPNDKLAIEGIASDKGRIAILVYLLDDAKSLLYPLRMSKAMIPLKAALRNGGTVYAPGMWFARHSKAFFGAEKFGLIKTIKRKLDPKGILNPGKIKGPRTPFLPGVDLSSVIYHGSNFIGPLAARLNYKGRPQSCLSNGAHR